MRQQPRFRQPIEIGFQRNRFLQHMARCTIQAAQILVVQSARFSGRVHTCAEKNFVRVKIADPSNQLLVQQDRFHCATVFSNYCLELEETNFERVRDWLNENRDVHVYFDNDAEGAAPKNALTLLEMLR